MRRIIPARTLGCFFAAVLMLTPVPAYAVSGFTEAAALRWSAYDPLVDTNCEKPAFGVVSRATVAANLSCYDTTTQQNAGAVLTYERPATGWDTPPNLFPETQFIAHPRPRADSFFGNQLDLEANTMVVQALRSSDLPSERSAHVFTRASSADPLEWQGRLRARPVGADLSGLALSGDVVAWGDGSVRHEAYVFVKPATGWPGAGVDLFETTTLAPRVPPSSRFTHFAVAVSGTTVAVLAPT